MVSIRKQGSATFSSARRTSRLGIAALVAIVVTLLGVAPALAATSTVSVDSDNELFYNAAPGQVNQIAISGDGTSLTVSDTGTDEIVPTNDRCTTVDLQTVTCVGANTIVVEASNLDDTITLTTSLLSEVRGQDGADTLNGGSGLDMLKGGPGDDILSGNAGSDVLFGEDGDDQLNGGTGSDTADYGSSSGATVDLRVTGPQDTGAGMDSLISIENVNGSISGGDVLTGDSGPNRFIGSGGNDLFQTARAVSEDGTDGSDVVNCGGGEDVVLLDRSDAIRGMTPTRNPCETVDDQMTPDTTITSGPSGPTNPNDPLHPLRWEFTSDEPWADFQCTVVDTLEDVSAPATSWDFCTSGHTISTPAEGTSKVFAVRAVDDQTNEDPTPDPRAFSVDTVAPGTAIDSGPSGGAVTTTSTPQFFFSSPDPSAGFLCRFDLGNFFECPNPFTAGPLSDGEHTLEVAAIDAAGNFDQTPASVNFRVATGGPGPSPGDGPAPNPQPAPVQQAKIIIGSLVLISGNAVKMSRRGRVPISLTCAGATKCSGRLSITTAEPVSKKSRKLVTLGAKKFTIAANKKRRINVSFSKSKMRLVKRLKRFKAKAVIREIDSRGNPRISTRIFILRAR
jgi:hypothetical protein